MRVWLVSDHAGYKLKHHLRRYLEGRYEVVDVGTFSEEATDYPQWVHQLMKEFDPAERAILLCGTGTVEIARLARAHNDANVLCLPARFLQPHEAEAIVETFLTTAFEGGRHERRIAQINPSSCC